MSLENIMSHDTLLNSFTYSKMEITVAKLWLRAACTYRNRCKISSINRSCIMLHTWFSILSPFRCCACFAGASHEDWKDNNNRFHARIRANCFPLFADAAPFLALHLRFPMLDSRDISSGQLDSSILICKHNELRYCWRWTAKMHQIIF